MAYMNKNAELKNGYNAYIDSAVDDMGTQMDIGLLLMEAGDTYVYEDAKKEVAILLFSGSVTYEWDGKKLEADRPDCFHHDAYCLLAGCGKGRPSPPRPTVSCISRPLSTRRPMRPSCTAPDKVQVEHKGFGGELMGCMSREIKTFFDLDNAPFSKMVLGEVLNLPGKWSSYPPHHHPQPEVYFYRFDYPDGFGAGFANGEIYKTQATMAAPSSTMASTPRVPRPAMPCATPGASGTWRAIPGSRPGLTTTSMSGCGRPMPTTTSIPITDRR